MRQQRGLGTDSHLSRVSGHEVGGQLAECGAEAPQEARQLHLANNLPEGDGHRAVPAITPSHAHDTLRERGGDSDRREWARV
jgi:hypothetical protein